VIFQETRLKGAFLVDLKHLEDERGFFARSFCQKEFLEHGLDPKVVQCNVSFNKNKGTVRGMHYQVPPCAEAKLVRCTSGAIYDVIVDLRYDSPTLLQWYAIELTAANRTALYIPKEFAHGFQTLADNTEVFYQMSEFYAPEFAHGFRWNDSLFNIQWPIEVSTISPKDQAYPDYIPEQPQGFVFDRS
jgi:dTDP-4-dehydrorhamnose 3,5-epimerase